MKRESDIPYLYGFIFLFSFLYNILFDQMV